MSDQSRTGEFGIRMALGASGASVIGMVLGETLKMVAIDLPGALALGRLISSRLYHAPPSSMFRVTWSIENSLK